MLFSLAATAMLVALTANQLAAQAPGTLDPDFGSNGVVFDQLAPGALELTTEIVALPNGGAYQIGYTVNPADVLIFKTLPNGFPDPSFGNQGLLLIDITLGGDEIGTAMHLLPNGNLLVVGGLDNGPGADAFITRILPDGSIDPDFGTNGFTMFNGGAQMNAIAYGIDTMSDGSIIALAMVESVSTNEDVGVFKFTPDGHPVQSFGSNGSMIFDLFTNAKDIPTDLEILPDDRMVISAHSETDIRVGVVMMLNSFGLIENSFNGTGKVVYNIGDANQTLNAVAAHDGAIYAAGFVGTVTNYNGIVLKLNLDGSYNTDFASEGVLTSDIGESNGIIFTDVKVFDSGHVLATGHAVGVSINSAYAMLLTEDGDPEFDFAPQGNVYLDLGVDIVEIQSVAAAIQPDGGILMTGYLNSTEFPNTNCYLLRLHSLESGTGIFESAEERISVKVYPNPASDYFRIDASGSTVERIDLYTMTGALVFSEQRPTGAIELPSHLPVGHYLVHIATEFGQVVRPIILQR